MNKQHDYCNKGLKAQNKALAIRTNFPPTFFVNLTTTELKENEAKIVSDMQHHFSNKKL